MSTSSTASPEIVLLTGVTGFLAAHVLDSLLASLRNYRVRGTLRSLGKKDALLQRFTPEQRKRIELVEVKDTASSDLTEALKDVTHVAHVASPYQLNVEDAERDLLKPAIEGTINLLRYAAKSSSVQRIALTSSFAAVTDFTKGGPNRPGFMYTSEDWNPSTYEDAVKAGGAGAFAYSASKKLSEKAAFDFIENEKPAFSLATFCPPMIYGATLQPGVSKESLNTSSKTVYNLLSHADVFPDDRLPLFCHARDVADAHVAWLAADGVDKTSRYLLCSPDVYTWGLAVDHLANGRSDSAQLKPRLPQGWEVKSTNDSKAIEERLAKLDTSQAERELGIKFKGFKQTLDETVDSLLQLEKNW